MKPTAREQSSGGGQAGFTIVEALVAIVVLIFGLMAVTNLMLVAAASNSVANQGTAATTNATEILEKIKATDWTTVCQPAGGNCTSGGLAWNPLDGGRTCNDPQLRLTDWHCTENTPGVGAIHTHWWFTATGDSRLLHIRIRSEGQGALVGARSRAEFTTFRGCTTNAAPCPIAP